MSLLREGETTRVDQRVAKIVRQRVGEHSGQPSVSEFGKIGKRERFARRGDRHGKGRQIDAGPKERGLIFD